MRTQEIKFTLKDGRTAILRSPKEEDLEGIRNYLYQSASETEFIMRTPEECSKYTLEYEKKYINKILESPNRAMIVCEVDGEIAGNCGIEWSNKERIKHRASVGIALLKEYWNLGIGTKMFEQLIEIATNNPDIVQIELNFVEGNSRARALYEKMGFKIVSYVPNAVKLNSGELANDYIMIRTIERNI